MFRHTAIGLAAAASLTLGTLVAPAAVFAAASHCSEYPDAPDCRTYNMPGHPPYLGSTTQVSPKAAKHAHYRVLHPHKG
jgi:hypothetical protein